MEQPKPDNPKDIKFNNYIFVNINKKSIMIPYDAYDDRKKIKRIFKENGRWCVKYEC